MIREPLPTGKFRLLACVLVWCFALNGMAEAQKAPPGGPGGSQAGLPLSPGDVKQIFVPNNRPADWPQGDWEAIGRGEYQKLLHGLKRKPPQPSPAKISNACYQAIFNGKQLRAGQLQAQIRQDRPRKFLSLEPVNLAVRSLWWENEDRSQPAQWGNSDSGRTLLLLPSAPSPGSETESPAPGRLRGEWSAAGRQHANRVEFDLQLLPAAINELELVLPPKWRLASSKGRVQGPLAIPADDSFSGLSQEKHSEFRLWRVSLGSETACQLTFNQSSAGPPPKPLVLAESDTTYHIRERELQVEARFELDVAFAPISKVVFEVPHSVHVFSVTYGGDPHLSWSREKGEARQRIVMTLPDPLVGKSRPIRIQGLGEVRLGDAWKLPPVTCSQAALLRGELHLTVQSPLELRSYESQGFRQTSISVAPDQRETLTFAQIASDPNTEFTAYLGTPAFKATAQIVSDMTTGTEEWLMQSEITWTAQSGSRFMARCDILPGWEVLDVRRPDESASRVISDWRVSKSEEKTRPQLTIEFLDALTPMQSKQVLVLARRLPLTAGQTMALSSVEPLSCRVVEQFLAVHSGKNNLLAAKASGENLQWKGRTLPGFVQNSSLISRFDPAERAGGTQLFFANSDAVKPQLTRNGGEAAYRGKARVLLEYVDQEFRETWIFSIEPLNLPIDEISLIAPALDERWRWELHTGQSLPLDRPNRVTPSAETKQNHWELSLPSPQTQAFEIRATRQSNPQMPLEPALPVLPAAEGFRGTVELNIPSSDDLTVQAEGMQAESQDEGAGPPARRRWRYRSADAALIVESRSRESGTTPAGRLNLFSLINGFNDSAVHMARLELEPRSPDGPLTFQFAKETRLIEVHLNGEEVVARSTEQGFVLSNLPADQRNRVEIRYQSPWNSDGVMSHGRVPIPQTGIPLLAFRWRFALSPNLQLSSPPPGTLLTSTLPEPHWTTRFFGPLGRGRDGKAFLPWRWSAWQSLLTSEAKPNGTDSGPEKIGFFPDGWTVHEASSPDVGDRLELTVWDRSRGFHLAWIGLLASLMCGFSFRLFRWPHHRQIGGFGFLVSLLGAGILPMPWAMIAGACLVGIVIAFLFPRRFLIRPKRRPRASDSVQSTASYRSHPVVSAMLFVLASGGLGFWALCNLAFPPHAPGQQAPESATSRTNDTTPIPRFNVMIPVDDPQNPKADSELVYVDRPFLKSLRAAQPEPPPDVRYLIQSARYSAQVDPEGAVEIAARYQVIVLTPDQSVTVRIPIDNADLGGPGHCRVDGQAHPVTYDAETNEYLVRLSPGPRHDAPIQPATAEKPGKRIRGVPAASWPAPVVRQIQLRMHGVAASLPNGGRYTLSIPAISNSQVRCQLPEEFASIGIRGRHGEIVSADNARSLRANLGASPQWEVLWSREAASLPVTTRREAQVYALATIHPLRLEWQIRVNVLAKNGLSSATWLLPPHTFVRNVQSEQVESYQVLRRRGVSRLLLEFRDPFQSELTVDLTCMMPREQSEALKRGHARLPALDFFGPRNRRAESMETEFFLGVLSSPELAILPVDPSGEDIAAIAPDKFLAGYEGSTTESDTSRTPESAWKLEKPRSLDLPINPRTPSRKVWLNQDGRIREQVLEWDFTAEVDTNEASAFRHALHVPSDLRIDSVSVEEDETERLVRWSRTGDHMELVLSDGTTGTQQIRLAGRMPIVLAPENRIPLPMIRIKEAETTDSRLQMSLDNRATHQVALTGLEDVSALDANGMETDENDARLIGRFRLTESEAAPVLVVRGPMSKARLDRAVILTPKKPQQWKIDTLMHFKDLEDSSQKFKIHIPESMTRDFHAAFANEPGEVVPYETTTNADQSLDLVFNTEELQEHGDLRFSNFIEVPQSRPKTIPWIQIPDGQVEDSLLLVPENFTIQTDHGAEASPMIDRDALPEWLREITDREEVKSAELQFFRDPAMNWRLIPGKSQSDRQAIGASAHTELWLLNPRKVIGRTTLQFPAPTRRTITWTWPRKTTLRAAELDGTLIASAGDQNTQSREFLIPSFPESQSNSGQRTLTLHWVRKFEKPMPRFGRMEFPIPKPQELRLEEATLSVVPPDHTDVIPQNGINLSQSSSSAGHTFQGELDSRQADWSFAFWTMDSRVEAALSLGILVLVLGGMMFGGIRLSNGEWLHRHLAVSLGLLGLFWWACLAGSAFGFALFAVSPALALMGKRQKPDDALPREPLQSSYS